MPFHPHATHSSMRFASAVSTTRARAVSSHPLGSLRFAFHPGAAASWQWVIATLHTAHCISCDPSGSTAVGASFVRHAMQNRWPPLHEKNDTCGLAS